MTNDLFFDTDCLSSFLWINNTNLLEQLYRGQIVIPEPVYRELSNPRITHLKRRTDALINQSVARIQQIELDTEEFELYRELTNGTNNRMAIGNGEAAGIALAKTYNGILASNNWRDIAPYITRYNLKHIDTGQILVDGLRNGLITEAQGNIIWKNMINKNRRLPERTFSDYLKKV